MRFLVVAIVTLALVPGLIGTARSAGYQVVGKEDCDCSSLVARGVYPDTLNKLHQAVYFPTVISAVDRVAMDLKSVVTHLAASPAAEPQESTLPTEETKIGPEKAAPPAEQKIQKEEKAKEATPATTKKKKANKKTTQSIKRKSTNKKQIKVPPHKEDVQ
jgi:hypothetical protein